MDFAGIDPTAFSTEAFRERTRGAVKRFLITCSGARPDILQRCPADEANYVGIGGAVLTTSVFAMVSSTSALTMALRLDAMQAAPLGFLWGLAIFNLDRWLVSTQTSGSMAQKLGGLVPRLALAVLIGAIISEPLVLRVFDSEIRAQMATLQTEDTAQLRDAIAAQFTPELERIDAEIAHNEQLLREQEAKVAGLRQAAFAEADGIHGTGLQGVGPVYEQKRAEADREQAVLDALRPGVAAEIARLREERALVQGDLDRRAAEAATVNAENTGLLQRARALSALKHEHASVAAFVWILRLVILTLDALPVLVKFLHSFGEARPYEQLLEAERRAYHEAQLAIVQAEARHLQAVETARHAAQQSVDVETVEAERDHELRRLLELREVHKPPPPPPPAEPARAPAPAMTPAVEVAGPEVVGPRPDYDQLELRFAMRRVRPDVYASPRRHWRQLAEDITSWATGR